jgi:hypothetical protein
VVLCMLLSDNQIIRRLLHLTMLVIIRLDDCDY